MQLKVVTVLTLEQGSAGLKLQNCWLVFRKSWNLFWNLKLALAPLECADPAKSPHSRVMTVRFRLPNW